MLLTSFNTRLKKKLKNDIFTVQAGADIKGFKVFTQFTYLKISIGKGIVVLIEYLSNCMCVIITYLNSMSFIKVGSNHVHFLGYCM